MKSLKMLMVMKLFSHACVYKWFKRPTEGYHGLKDDMRSRQMSTAQSRNSSQCEMAATEC